MSVGGGKGIDGGGLRRARYQLSCERDRNVKRSATRLLASVLLGLLRLLARRLLGVGRRSGLLDRRAGLDLDSSSVGTSLLAFPFLALLGSLGRSGGGGSSDELALKGEGVKSEKGQIGAASGLHESKRTSSACLCLCFFFLRLEATAAGSSTGTAAGSAALAVSLRVWEGAAGV